MNQYKIKQVIVMRTDLNMRKGKMAAQAGHASMMFLSKRFEFIDKDLELGNVFEIWLSDVEREWFESSYAKICVGIDSQEALMEIVTKAAEARLEVSVVTDNGATEFHSTPTVTCCAIGPDYSDKIDLITGKLKLL